MTTLTRTLRRAGFGALVLLGVGGTVLAGSFTVLGPQNYLRDTGEPVTVITNFSVLNPAMQYTLKIYNGGLTDGEFDRVSSSIIKINGLDLVSPSEFNQNVAYIEKPIPLNSGNALSVELHGQPGGGITVLIVGVDNDPPTITASASPQPNAAGWNKTNVTVTFTCNDANSGIASCTSPVTVSTEGANQVVTGTATDRAGNTATTSVTVNLDKTAPSVTPAIAPAPNGADWNNTDVVITYACADGLSDVQSCPAPITTTAEGAGQVISATATDVAGNSATSTVTLNIDKTPPAISPAASPAANAHGWNNTDVTVSFTCTDALSGVASCPAAVTTTTEGAGQVIAGTATDRAGDGATGSATLNIDKTLPILTIIGPTGNTTGVSAPEIDVRYSDALSGIDTPSLRVSVDGNLIPNCSVAAEAAACLPPSLTAGSHTIAAMVDDLAGNRIATSSSFTLNLNAPPVLTPIGSQTAILGQTLTFTVHATDPGGDPVTLMVTPIPLPEHATFSGTTGVFTFRPASDQIGAHVLTFTASDGTNQVSETITITVPAPQPSAPTTLEGVLLDASSAMNGSTVPIVGATVSLLGTSTSALSNAQGHFVVNNAPAGKQVLDIAPGTGQPAPDGSNYGGFREAITLTAHVPNIVERPFFLPRIDPASVTPVNPNTTTVVTNPNLGVSITVPAHTAKNPNGTDFVGDLSISLVPRGLAPAQLPPNLDPALLVTIQPVGVVFATPVPMTFPNLDHMAVGNDADLWSLLANEGRFAVVGKGQVSSSGQSVQTVAGGVRAADWHAFLPPEPTGSPRPHQDCPTCQLSHQLADGASATLDDGGLLEDYSPPAVRSLVGGSGPQLAYRSTTADVRPIIGQDVFLGIRTAVPQRYSAMLNVGGVTQGSTVLYDSSGLPENADSTSRLGVQFDASALRTGEYGFSAAIFSRYEQTVIGTFTGGNMLLVNRQKGPYGAGWGIAGLQRIHLQASGRAVVTDGDGTSHVFAPASQGAFVPTADALLGRTLAAATVLADGRVLVSGGFGRLPNGNIVVSPAAQIYDPSTGTWSATGNMHLGRYAHTSTLLRDGRVLVAGGNKNSVDLGNTFGSLVTEFAEVYDTVTGQFSNTNNTMNEQRSYHTATLLGDGRVLITGGDLGGNTAELFDPVNLTFRRTHTDMSGFRTHHTATLLQDGRVLLAGGGQFGCNNFERPYFSTEIYNPLTEQFSDSASMVVRRSDHQAALLPDGRVLITGGVTFNACRVTDPQDSAEIVDPAAGSSTLLASHMCSPRSSFQMVPLPDGHVLATGGYVQPGSRVATACSDLFDPVSRTFTPTPPMSVARAGHVMVVLPDARVLTALGSPNIDAGNLGVTSSDLFEQVGQPGAFVSPAGDFTVLHQNQDGTFTRTYKNQTVISYNAQGLMTSVVDRNNNTTTYAYDAAERLLTMTGPTGQVWTLAYDGDGRLHTITDPANRVTTFAHDTQGNLTQIVKPDGHSIAYAYDAQHRLTTKTDERGKVTTNTYDASGRLASVAFPGGEVRQINPVEPQGVADTAAGTGGTPPAVILVENVQATTTDGNGKVTTYTVNPFGSPLTATDPLSQTTRTVYDSNNLPTQITRPNGSIVSMTYDTRGNRLTLTEQNDPNGPATTTYTYEPVFNQVTSISDPLNHTTTIDHDAHGNPTTITDARGKATILTYDTRGLLTSSQDPLGNTAQFAYDAQGNVHTITDPRGKVTTLTRDAAGNVTASEDPLTHVTHTEYDALDRVTRVIDALNGITRYGYDEAGNLTSLTDANDHATTFTYEDRNLLATTRNPLGQTKSYFHDPARNVDHVIDAKGQRIEFTYDDARQMTRKLLKNSAAIVTDTVNYGYDLLGNLATASDSDSGLSFTYDPLGRLSTALTIAGPAQPASTISYLYDKVGNRTRMTDPHNNPTTYVHDTVNRLTTLTSIDGTFTFGYDEANRRTSLGFPNSTSATYAYDAASQLTALHYLNSAQALLSKFDYTYDNKGNRDSRTTLEGLTSYTYDPLDRLAGAVGPNPANPTQTATETYEYDQVGNRTFSHLATGQVHDAANRLLGDSRSSYTYDANGNVTRIEDNATNAQTTYDWDVEDRLVAMHTSIQTVTFRYDPLGRRIEKGSLGTARYIYDQEDILESLDGTNALASRYSHGPRVDEPLARRGISGTPAYYVLDGLASVTDLANVSGQSTATQRYDSNGRPLTNSTNAEYSFTGREWDPETRLLYLRARYYDPMMGRFLSEDPIGFSGSGVNDYVYVYDNPVNMVDPFGLAHR